MGKLKVTCLLLAVALLLSAAVPSIIIQDANGVQSARPIGRGLYLDQSNNTIRTLTWGGLYSLVPNTLWITPSAGGNAGPVRLDPSVFVQVPDPLHPGSMLLTALIPHQYTDTFVPDPATPVTTTTLIETLSHLPIPNSTAVVYFTSTDSAAQSFVNPSVYVTSLPTLLTTQIVVPLPLGRPIAATDIITVIYWSNQ